MFNVCVLSFLGDVFSFYLFVAFRACFLFDVAWAGEEISKCLMFVFFWPLFAIFLWVCLFSFSRCVGGRGEIYVGNLGWELRRLRGKEKIDRRLWQTLIRLLRVVFAMILSHGHDYSDHAQWLWWSKIRVMVRGSTMLKFISLLSWNRNIHNQCRLQIPNEQWQKLSSWAIN